MLTIAPSLATSSLSTIAPSTSLLLRTLLIGISQNGEREELVNDSWTLEEAGLFIPLLKLVERKGNQEEKLLNAEISNLIGKKLHEFDIMGAEVGQSLLS